MAIVVVLVLALTTSGMTEASTTLSPSRPWTRQYWSTTASVRCYSCRGKAFQENFHAKRGRLCMDSMQSIAPAERGVLSPLFTDHRHLRPDVDAVLQGHCGTALANTGSGIQVAQLSLSVLTFFGGDATHPIARRLVEQASGETIILVASEAWRALVRHIHGPGSSPSHG